MAEIRKKNTPVLAIKFRRQNAPGKQRTNVLELPLALAQPEER
jgi:hypothetical protein